MKARILLRQLELPYERVQVDLFKGETRTPEHFARNPDGRVPVLELDSGETIAESNAILLHLAEGTQYLPTERLTRTRVDEWMFFEQNRIEAELAYARFLHLSGRDKEMPEVYASRLERGSDALAALDRGLSDGRQFLAGPATPWPTSRCTRTCIAPTTPAPTSAGTSISAAGSNAWRRSPAL